MPPFQDRLAPVATLFLCPAKSEIHTFLVEFQLLVARAPELVHLVEGTHRTFKPRIRATRLQAIPSTVPAFGRFPAIVGHRRSEGRSQHRFHERFPCLTLAEKPRGRQALATWYAATQCDVCLLSRQRSPTAPAVANFCVKPTDIGAHRTVETCLSTPGAYLHRDAAEYLRTARN